MRNEEVNPVNTYFLDLRKELESLSQTKIDLSDLFDNTMNEMLENGFRWFGLRQIDYSKPCSCKSTVTSATPVCTRCFRIGYTFTDYLVKGYMWISSLGFEFRTSVGDIATQRKNLVVKHNRPINKLDRILLLDSDSETGRLKQPFIVTREYSIQDSMSLVGKNGRVEFWRCSLEERNMDDGRAGEQGADYSYKGNRSNAEPE
jgi:hypothetical protein